MVNNSSFSRLFQRNILTLQPKKLSMSNDINRLKVVLAEKKKTNRWLANQLGKDESTISKWCTNTIQPSLEQLREIANVLDTNVASLLCDSYFNE